jgi:hypothetical protein
MGKGTPYLILQLPPLEYRLSGKLREELISNNDN